jgi:hypothetical protein
MESFEGGEGALAVCLDGHRAAYRTLSNWLGKAADPTLSATAEAVAGTAAYYERTDTTNAANLDATYPDADVAAARERAKHVPLESEGTARFADVTEPAKHPRRGQGLHRGTRMRCAEVVGPGGCPSSCGGQSTP